MSETRWEQGLFALSAPSVSAKHYHCDSPYTNIESFYFSLNWNVIKAYVKPYPIPNLPSAKSYSGKYLWECQCFMLHSCSRYYYFIPTLKVSQTHLETTPLLIPSHPLQKKPLQQPTSKHPNQRLSNNDAYCKKLERNNQEINKATVDYVRVDAISITCISTNEFQYQLFMWPTSKCPTIHI